MLDLSFIFRCTIIVVQLIVLINSNTNITTSPEILQHLSSSDKPANGVLAASANPNHVTGQLSANSASPSATVDPITMTTPIAANVGLPSNNESQDYLAAVNEIMQPSGASAVTEQPPSTQPTSTALSTVVLNNATTVMPLSMKNVTVPHSVSTHAHNGTTVASGRTLSIPQPVPEKQTQPLIKCYECITASADNCVAGTCYGTVCTKAVGTLESTVLIKKGCITLTEPGNGETIPETCGSSSEMNVQIQSCYCQSEYCNQASRSIQRFSVLSLIILVFLLSMWFRVTNL